MFKALGVITLALAALAGIGLAAAYYAEEQELPDVVKDALS